MFSHVMVGSNDIERSKRFYDAVLAVVGAGEGGVNHHISHFFPFQILIVFTC